MRNKLRFPLSIALFSLVIVCFFTGSTYGQVGFYLGLDGGVSSQRLDLKDVKFDKDTTFVYGAKVGIRILFLGIEAQYFQTSHNLSITDFPGIGWSGHSVNYNYMGLNGKVFMPFPIIHPYLTLGYGYYTVKLQDIDEDITLNFNYGIGLELKLGDHLALQGECKYHPNSVILASEDVEVKNFTIVGGISYFF